MKEITRIATVRLTAIIKTDDNMTDIVSKEAVKERLTKVLSSIPGMDNVVVDDVQDFIRDVEKKGVVEDGRCEVDQDNN